VLFSDPIKEDATALARDFRFSFRNANRDAWEIRFGELAGGIQRVEGDPVAGGTVIPHGRRVPSFVDWTRDDDLNYAGHLKGSHVGRRLLKKVLLPSWPDHYH